MIYKNLPDLFNYFHIAPKDRERVERILTSEGYTTLGICYGAARSEEKLLHFAGDSRLPNIFINEVRKNALRAGDPRWENRKEN
jgi:hypothetical protein